MTTLRSPHVKGYTITTQAAAHISHRSIKAWQLQGLAKSHWCEGRHSYPITVE